MSVNSTVAEHAISIGNGTHARQERFDLVNDRVWIAEKRDVIVAWQFHEGRFRNSSCDLTALSDIDYPVTRAVNHERRHLDVRQDMPDVELREDLRHLTPRAGGRAKALEAGPPTLEPLVVAWTL